MEKFTYRGLKCFAYGFFILAAFSIVGAIGLSIFGEFGNKTDQMAIAASRLGRTMVVFGGIIYCLIFVFGGLVSHALAILVKKSLSEGVQS